MATYPQNYRFGEFVASLIRLIFWILVIIALVVLPLIFVILFFVPLPVNVNGEVYTPYLFLTDMVNPTRTLPIIKYMIHTELFKVAVFPGFSFAAIIAAATIFIERKFLAKMQLRVGPLYAGKIEGILQ